MNLRAEELLRRDLRRLSSATARRPEYASHRDAVRVLMQAGEPFAEVEEAIEGSDLDEDARAALWLLAFSLRS